MCTPSHIVCAAQQYTCREAGFVDAADAAEEAAGESLSLSLSPSLSPCALFLGALGATLSPPSPPPPHLSLLPSLDKPRALRDDPPPPPSLSGSLCEAILGAPGVTVLHGVRGLELLASPIAC
jgi:hypothetical protein